MSQSTRNKSSICFRLKSLYIVISQFLVNIKSLRNDSERTSSKENHREKAKVVRTCQEKGRRDILRRMLDVPGKRGRDQADSRNRGTESLGLKKEEQRTGQSGRM